MGEGLRSKAEGYKLSGVTLDASETLESAVGPAADTEMGMSESLDLFWGDVSGSFLKQGAALGTSGIRILTYLEKYPSHERKSEPHGL